MNEDISRFDTTFITNNVFLGSGGEIIRDRGQLVLAACNSGKEIQRKIVDYTRQQYEQDHSSTRDFIDLEDCLDGKPLTHTWDDGELRPRIPIAVRGKDVMVIASLMNLQLTPSVNDNLMEMFFVGRAFRSNGAKHVVAVVPYLAYGRADKPTQYKREGTLVKLLIDFLKTAGYDGLILYHSHSDLHGCVENRKGFDFISIDPADLIASVNCESRNRSDTIVISPDNGSASLAMHVADILNLDYGIINKNHDKDGKLVSKGLLANLKSIKRCIMGDDETYTFKTMLEGMKIIYENGIYHTEGWLSHAKGGRPAIEVAEQMHEECGLEGLCASDSVPQIEEFLDLGFVRRYTTAPRLAWAINHLHNNQSTSGFCYPECPRELSPFVDVPLPK